MTKFEDWYLNTTDMILSKGVQIGDRTGTGTLSIFTVNYTHNLIEEPFPILSCRKFNYENPILEMIGFMRGITNSNWYSERGCPFWNGFGLPEDITKSIRKPDHILADEYCSANGHYKGHEQFYRDRYKQLNDLGLEEGLKVILDSGINLYDKEVVGKKGDLGPIYGHMWRYWPCPSGKTFDQLQYAFDELRLRPQNRRIIVNGWNPAYLPDYDKEPHENVVDGNMSLTPCHVLHEYHTSPIPCSERIRFISEYGNVNDSVRWEVLTNKNPTEDVMMDFMDEVGVPRYYLDISWFQRSWDFMLGAPANIGGYASMLMMMANLQGMIARYVDVKAVNVHIYNNHIEGANTILTRREMGMIPKCRPKMSIKKNDKVTFIDQFEPSDFKLDGYEHLSHVKFPISI